MDIHAIHTQSAPAAIGPYSQAIRAGDVVYVSGQLPINPMDNTAPEGVAAQTRQSLLNLRAVLAAIGAGLENVVKTTVFMKNLGEFATMNDVYAEFFSHPYPARSTVEAARLPRDVLVEIDAIAIIK